MFQRPARKDFLFGTVPVNLRARTFGSTGWFVITIPGELAKLLFSNFFVLQVDLQGKPAEIVQFYSPTIDVRRFRKGQRELIKIPLLPSYLLFEMVLGSRAWIDLEDLGQELFGSLDFAKVLCNLGRGKKGRKLRRIPAVLSEEDVLGIRDIESGKRITETILTLDRGDKVVGVGGVFDGFEGEVLSRDFVKRLLTVRFSVANKRFTSVLEPSEIAKIRGSDV